MKVHAMMKMMGRQKRRMTGRPRMTAEMMRMMVQTRKVRKKTPLTMKVRKRMKMPKMKRDCLTHMKIQLRY